MPFWTSLFSSVLFVVRATNSRTQSSFAASTSPVSSQSEVPVFATAAHSGELGKLARLCWACVTCFLQNCATSWARRESWRGVSCIGDPAASRAFELGMVLLQRAHGERLL